MAEKSAPLERYVTVLETLGAASEGLSLSEVAGRCGLPVGTAHRLLQNLRRTGLIASAGADRRNYRLGERLLRLLHAGSDTAWLQISVQPILDALANELAETCFLTRLVGHQVISLAWAVPAKGLQGYVFPGHVMPPHAAASAKAVLAFQAPAIVRKALAGKLPKLTAHTKVKRSDIDREYAGVRVAGYATCWNEIDVGLGAFAVPVHVQGVGIMYSLGVSGVIDRLARRPVPDTVKRLTAAAEALARVLPDRTPKQPIPAEPRK
jgi:DNA-binding IclR family transcriptional regulator